MTTAIQLQHEISGTERAIRHITGNIKAEKSKLARAEALLKLEKARLKRIENVLPSLAKASRFPDVSNNNGSVDVQTVRHAGDVRVGALLVTKITEGTGFVDTPGLQRAKAMEAAGFPNRGFYCFLHPSESGTAQADFLLHTLEAGGVKLLNTDILICDCEVTDGEPASNVALCAHDFQAQLARHVENERWLYGGGPFLHENGVSLSGYHGHWLAAYVSNPAQFEVFGAGSTIAWQFTDGHLGPMPHDCPGIGPCDLSIVLR